MTLSTTDEQKLMLELGFGLLFLRKLKDFLRQVAKGDKTQSFLFGFEAVCYETLVSLADDLMDNPAKLASYRLQYHLTQAQDNASENTIAQDKVDNVLNLLRRMRNNSFTVQDIAAALPASLSAQSLVVMLARSGLIYHSDFLARKKLYVWRITALGEEIAALAQDSALAKC